MSDMEALVRPFQLNEFAPARPYYNSGTIGVPNVRIMAGRGGQGKTFNSSGSSKQTNYMTKYVSEKKTATFGTQF